MTDNSDIRRLLPLTPPAFHILLALADEELHGYAIMQEVRRRTAGRVRMGAGTLYGNVKRLLGQGLIEESGKRPDPDIDDERRRYYRLTSFGFKVAKAEAERLERLVADARAKNLLDSPETA